MYHCLNGIEEDTEMKGLRLKGCLLVAAVVIGFQWYVEANPVVPHHFTPDSHTSLVEKIGDLSTTLPLTQVQKSVDHHQHWFYHFETDALRQQTKEFGANHSLNKHIFDFPYNKGAWLNIETISKPIKNKNTLKGHAPVMAVLLTTTDGQFDCGIYGCDALASFDGGKVERFHLEMLNGNPNNVMVMTDGKRFLNEVSKHKSVIIEVDYFQNPGQQFRFSLKDKTNVTYSA